MVQISLTWLLLCKCQGKDRSRIVRKLDESLTIIQVINMHFSMRVQVESKVQQRAWIFTFPDKMRVNRCRIIEILRFNRLHAISWFKMPENCVTRMWFFIVYMFKNFSLSKRFSDQRGSTPCNDNSRPNSVSQPNCCSLTRVSAMKDTKNLGVEGTC